MGEGMSKREEEIRWKGEKEEEETKWWKETVKKERKRDKNQWKNMKTSFIYHHAKQHTYTHNVYSLFSLVSIFFRDSPVGDKSLIE